MFFEFVEKPKSSFGNVHSALHEVEGSASSEFFENFAFSSSPLYACVVCCVVCIAGIVLYCRMGSVVSVTA